MSQKTIFLMKFIHRWLGLIGGWFLFIIVTSGCLTLFSNEIAQWMQPELSQIQSKDLSAKALDQAYKIWTYNQNKPKNMIILPTKRDPFLYVSYIDNKLRKTIILDPHEGSIIPVRNTAGSTLITAIHKTLYMSRSIGQFILLLVSSLFIITLITGIVLHFKPFLKTLFNLQLKTNPLRVQLNYHTTIGIIFFPFLFIIALSGFLFVAPHYFSPQLIPTKPNLHSHKENLVALSHQNLFELVQKSEQYFKNKAGFIFFSPKEIKISEAENSHLSNFKNIISYDKNTGQFLSYTSLSPIFGYPQKVIFGIHKGRAGGLIFRTLNFIMGFGSIILIAFGLLYYSNRYQEKTFEHRTCYLFHKTIEGINTGVIMGSLIGFISLFWINRLIPIDYPNRISCEIWIFFSIVLSVFIYSCLSAYLNKTYKAFKKLLFILSYLCLLLPVLDLITNFSLFKIALTHQNYLYIKIDSIIFLFGVCSLLFCSYLKRKRLLI